MILWIQRVIWRIVAPIATIAGARTVSAKAIVRRGDRRLLVRSPGGIWELPGGRPRDGELPEAALVREVEEETGLRVQPGRLLTAELTRDSRGRWAPHVILLVYEADLADAQAIRPPGLSREHLAARWFSLDDLDRIDPALVPGPTPALIRASLARAS